MSVTDIDLIAWHAWRREGLGGSDVPALVGLSRYASPTSLYYEKVGLLEPHEETDRQRIGKRMEAVLGEEFHDQTGLYIVGEQTWCTHPKHSWARCTPDGFVVESEASDIDGALGTAEKKTDGRYGWPDGIPANIRAQVVWQMGVTGYTHAWVVVMFAGFRVEVFELDWDTDVEADWNYLFATAERFWFEHVVAGVPPEPDGSQATTDALTAVHSEPEGLLEADDFARSLVQEVRAAKESSRRAEEREDRLCNALRAYLGDQTDLVDGWTQTRKGPKARVIASWRSQSVRHVDLDAMRAEHLALVEAHTTTTTTRVLRVPTPRGEP